MNLIFRTVALAAVVALSACGTTKPGSATRGEETIQNLSKEDFGKKIGGRAVQRWKNIINKKFDEAYEMLSPGYRQTHDKKDYAEIIANRPVRWTNATFVGHECATADVCTVRVNIEFNLLMPSVGTVKSENIVEEKWIRAENEWYFFPDNAGK